MPAVITTLRQEFQDLAFQRSDAEVSISECAAANALGDLNSSLEASLNQFSVKFDTTVTLPDGKEILAGEYEALRDLACINSLSLNDLLSGIIEVDAGAVELAVFRDLGIHDVTPLAALSGLRSLNLSDNRIADISPLAGQSKLQWLHLGNNSIIDISPLSGLSELKVIALSYNRIDDIRPLAGLAKLRTLYLSINRVPDISPLAGLNALEDLTLCHNPITDISPLTGLTGLRLLSVDTAALSLDGHTAIDTLTARGVQVKK